jgi:hypothetical protein
MRSTARSRAKFNAPTLTTLSEPEDDWLAMEHRCDSGDHDGKDWASLMGRRAKEQADVAAGAAGACALCEQDAVLIPAPLFRFYFKFYFSDPGAQPHAHAPHMQSAQSTAQAPVQRSITRALHPARRVEGRKAKW